MSRSTSDRSQQQSHPNVSSQNQQIQQVVRLQTSSQQLTQSAGSLIVIGGDGQRSILSTVNPQNSILYSTPPQALAGTSGSNNNVGRNQSQATPTSHHDASSPIAKKRLKLDTDASTNVDDSPAKRRERIQEHKQQRLKALKERTDENITELYFLQMSGNMMDYPAWKKKPSVPRLVQLKNSIWSDQSGENDSLRVLSQHQPEGAEIKIPGVGSTPIAISKQLPAAVAQLTQKGGTPIVPIEQKRLATLSSIIIGSTNGSPSTSSFNQSVSTPTLPQQYNSSSDQLNSVKAKEEVNVLQRVQELKREGLWMGTRLPKIAEPARIKVHWDFLLEEMHWISTDFAQERKWKKAAAKKIAKAVQKYFQDKESAAQRAEKAQEQNLKRIAAFIAKEVKTFWSNAEKLVQIKQDMRLEAKRKLALNEKLKFIVDQTEKYSQQVAEGMTKKAPGASKATSLNSSRISSPLPRNASDDEWSRPNEDSEDDEETIAKAEAEIPVSSTKDEIDALEKESKMEFDDFLNTLPKDYLQNRDKIVVEESDSASDKEFEDPESEEDDEDTIMEQEKTEKVDHKAEIDNLKAEGEMSLEELRAKYNLNSTDNEAPLDSDDEESTATEASSDEEMEVDSDDEESENESVDETEPKDVGLKNLLEDHPGSSADNCDNGDELLQNVAALAQSIQPKGNTLTSTDVVTPIPFLLKHKLREYQHIGLDWLVTMHDRKLNGILADEMGLGKTIQTIALLAHLACVKENWGPHLIVVPSSVMLNWEMEFKKWCPGFKILTYYGSQKERKLKRNGWTKPNAFHVCITSYKLVIQDHQSFRRKKWKYLILDEAQNIKNFKSQRWQLLLNFVTEQRLLLTGTPLQNNMMELWSLMHFLMPNFFESHRTFEELFSKPMTGMVEGNVEYNKSIIEKLHKVLRPFLLRRLKSEVEKQMPKKYEHVEMCRLSKRQRFLYDDFMSRAQTKEKLASGNMLGVINVLMQLRKVCNHPNLFEVRPTVSPFRMEPINMQIPSMLTNIFQYDPLKDIDLNALNLVLIQYEQFLTGYVAHRMKSLAAPKKLIEEIDSSPELPPCIPKDKFKMYLRVKPAVQNQMLNRHKVGTSPDLRNDAAALARKNSQTGPVPMVIDDDNRLTTPIHIPSTSGMPRQKPTHQLIQSSTGQILLVNNKQQNILTKQGMMIVNQQPQSSVTQPLASAVIDAVRNATQAAATASSEIKEKEESEFVLADLEEAKRDYRLHLLQLLSKSNLRKIDAQPIYGEDLRDQIYQRFKHISELENFPFVVKSYVTCSTPKLRADWSLSEAIRSTDERAAELRDIFERFVFVVPRVTSEVPSIIVSHQHPSQKNEEDYRVRAIQQELGPTTDLLHPISSAMATQFPDPRLIQYDCGKLQSLQILLRRLRTGNHRVLIFTQMTKMLDILEQFLNYHGHIYLRLDGTTKVEQRQLLMERFNEDKRIFVFILSTRSGGVGVNLTGADTVIFYDSDWNPTIDAQAQDRCHRIGQTRDVHIYRLISEKTIEENILKKANQKRLLSDLTIEGGNFNDMFFKGSLIQDLFNVDQRDDASARLAEVLDKDRERRERLVQSLEGREPVDKNAMGALESALAEAEDEQDAAAAKTATAEIAGDLDEFDENIPIVDEKDAELTKKEKEFQCIIEQMTPVERLAMKFVEDMGASDWAALQLRAVEEEMENQKREWEEKQLVQRQQEELERQRAEREDNELLTYSRDDALNKIWMSMNTMEIMPMWCPPTPPQDGSDIYIDHSLRLLYDTHSFIDEGDLPAIYVKKDYKRMRTDDGYFMDGRKHFKMRKEDGYVPPRSLFDRPSPALAKMRKDLKQQRNRGLIRSMPMANIKQQIPLKPMMEPEGMPEWTIFEDRAILNVIQGLQSLPINLLLISPGHTPNWDLVADVVNLNSRTYRSPKHCRWRYEAVIVPREEGKLLDSPKKQKKTKNLLKQTLKNQRSPRTAQLYQNDNNKEFLRLAKTKFDNIKSAMLKKQPPLKKFASATQLNQKHIHFLSELGINNYDMPQSPIDIATRLHERLVQDRTMQQQRTEQIQSQSHQSPIHQQSSQPQLSSIPQTTIVVQQPGGMVAGASPSHNVQTGQQQIALVHQGQRLPQTINLSPAQGSSQQQIMKAIVASPGGGHQQALLTGIIQQINPSQIQNSQSNLMQTSSVSVVLTSPPTTTVTSVQPQIVSIQPTVATSTPIVSLPGSIVHTQAGQGQLVSVAQLGSTSLTAQPIGTSPQIRQTRTLSKEVIFQPRPGTQSPTVISLSGLNAQGLNATLRFTSNLNQAGLRAATTGDKQQIVQGKRFEIVQTSPQYQITTLPPQAGQQRQKLRILQAGPFSQAGSAQTTLATSSAVGQTMQVAGGQKITVATINPTSSGSQTSQTFSEAVDTQTSQGLTVQVTPQQRTQFIKQVNSVISQSPNQKVLMVKHHGDIQQYKTGQLQLTSQTQLAYAPSNIQLQPSSSGQQITTLIKTTSAQGISTVAGTTSVPMKLTPVRANIAQGSTVRQVIPQMMGLQGPRKASPKGITRFTQVTPNRQGSFVLQEVKGLKPNTNQIFISNPNAIPVSVSQATNVRGEALQFVTPTSRGIPTANIRFQQVSPVVALQRRQPTVTLQKPPTGTAQVTIDASSVSPSTSSQQGQIATSPSASSQQNVAQQPQHSPQQK